MERKTVRDIDRAYNRMFIIVDVNVTPDNGVLSDDSRIRAFLPTIQYLIDKEARVILCSRLGRGARPI